MTRPMVTIHDASTDEIVVREMNDEEFADFEARLAIQEFKDEEAKAKETAKKAAQAKLAALGLTTDDLKALGL